MSKKNNIWNYSVEEIVNGYTEEKEEYKCVFCNAAFAKGHIYKIEEEFYDAYGTVMKHIASAHGNAADWLLDQETGVTGISEIQKNILKLISDGKNDKEISGREGIAESTVRNHRFKLREKEKQAKLFLALMKSLEDKINKNISDSDKGKIEEAHITATMLDDRYAITASEREKTIKTYMDENGAIKQLPAKQKKKLILLKEIMKNFKPDIAYTEKEVNRILKRIYEEDYTALRRALIEYGFMDRADDGSLYRMKTDF